MFFILNVKETVYVSFNNKRNIWISIVFFVIIQTNCRQGLANDQDHLIKRSLDILLLICSRLVFFDQGSWFKILKFFMIYIIFPNSRWHFGSFITFCHFFEVLCTEKVDYFIEFKMIIIQTKNIWITTGLIWSRAKRFRSPLVWYDPEQKI